MVTEAKNHWRLFVGTNPVVDYSLSLVMSMQKLPAFRLQANAIAIGYLSCKAVDGYKVPFWPLPSFNVSIRAPQYSNMGETYPFSIWSTCLWITIHISLENVRLSEAVLVSNPPCIANE